MLHTVCLDLRGFISVQGDFAKLLFYKLLLGGDVVTLLKAFLHHIILQNSITCYLHWVDFNKSNLNKNNIEAESNEKCVPFVGG